MQLNVLRPMIVDGETYEPGEHEFTDEQANRIMNGECAAAFAPVTAQKSAPAPKQAAPPSAPPQDETPPPAPAGDANGDTEEN